MSFAKQVAVGPEFFLKAKNDYSDHYWAFIREFFQNCLDAPGTTRVDVTIGYDEANGVTVIGVQNDGEPMTEEVLTGKLLSLGSSGKDGDAKAVGGFGKAKEILYFCHKSYSIDTGDFVVTGSGGGYDLEPAPAHFHGTRSVVRWSGDVAERLERNARKLIGLSAWSGTFTLNGETVQGGLGKGTRKRVFPWGSTYSNGAIPNQVVVRINGMPMFAKSTESPQGIIVELTGKSTDVLTGNRDGLKYPFGAELDEFITQLAIDSGSALRVAEPEYLHVRGDKLNRNEADEQPTIAAIGAVIAALTATVGRGQSEFPAGHSERQSGGGMFDEPKAKVSHDFVVKNTTGRKLPACFDPCSPRFSAGALRVTKMWAWCLMELHAMFDHRAEFSVGFIFDIERLAEFEEGRYGTVYYINPCVPGDPTFKPCLTPKEKFKILSYAAHEFTHGLGHHYHGEEFANRLTLVMERVTADLGRFAKCFKP